MAARKLTIIAVGDSTTAGAPGFRSPLEAPPKGRGNPQSQYAFWMMKVHPEWTVLNRGMGRQRCDEILARFDRDVLKVKPDYVIVLAGANDVYQGRSLGLMKTDLGAMYGRAQQISIIPVAATVLPYDTAGIGEQSVLKSLNAWIQQNAASLDIPFCDTNAAVRAPDDPGRLRSSPDGLHPDITGYRSLGEALMRTLETDLARWAQQA